MTTPRRDAAYIPLSAAACTLAVYLVTMNREVGAGDAAELALQAYQLGVTHAPGYPLHTLLGKVVGLVVPSPAMATTLLSVVCAALAAGVLSRIVLHLTANRVAAVAAPLFFGFLPAVWDMAIVTEVYALNVSVVAVVIWQMLRWDAKATSGRLALAAALFGLSLGSSLANLLLLPGLALLIARSRNHPWRRLLLFGLVMLATATAIMSWTYLRAAAVPPLGSAHRPDTPGGFFAFVSGSQYGTMQLHSVAFYVDRFVEHGLYWGRSTLWIGLLLAATGWMHQWRSRRPLAIGLLAMFAADYLYFTFYPWVDYRQMVMPAYFLLSLWVGCGIATCMAFRRIAIVRIAAVAVPAALVVTLLVSGWRNPNERGAHRPMEEFIADSFEVFPRNATVFANWYKLTPLLYAQVTRGTRPDVTIVERADGPRHYTWGKVESWRTALYDKVTTGQPVVIDLARPPCPEGYHAAPLHGVWFEISQD